MKENEEIFGTNNDNELLENVNTENNEFSIEEVVEKENINPVLNSIFPDYSAVVEPVAPVEEVASYNSFEENNVEEKSQNFDIPNYNENIESVSQIEEVIGQESIDEPIENNNVFGENVVEITEEVVNPLIPNYSESVEPVMPVEEVVEPTEVNNVFGENVVETTEEVVNPLIPNYSESVEPVMPVEEVVEPTEVNNVFGENVVESDNVEETAIPNYSETYEPVAPVEDVVLNDNDIENVQTDNITKENGYNPMEHPDAKIVLNKNVEEEKEVDSELSEMKIGETLKENSSLRFVIILGIIILIAIIAIPYVSQLLG